MEKLMVVKGNNNVFEVYGKIVDEELCCETNETKVIVNGLEKDDFGEKFSGVRVNPFMKAESLILSFLNDNKEGIYSYVHPDIVSFKEKYQKCQNGIPVKYWDGVYKESYAELVAASPEHHFYLNGEDKAFVANLTHDVVYSGEDSFMNILAEDYKKGVLKFFETSSMSTSDYKMWIEDYIKNE